MAKTTAERGAGTTRRQIGGPDRWAIARARTGGRAAWASAVLIRVMASFLERVLRGSGGGEHATRVAPVALSSPLPALG